MRLLKSDPFAGKDLTYVFASLVALLLLIPGSYFNSPMTYVVNLIFTFMVANIIYYGIGEMRQHRFIVVIGVVSVVLLWASSISRMPLSQYLYIVSHFIFYLYFSFLLAKSVIKSRVFTNNTIFGALSIFLTVAFAWGYMYALIYMCYPHTISSNVRIDETNMIETMIYFSFEVITTLGFGDIYPASQQVGSLVIAEAIFGQIYLAVVIAKIVSLSMISKEKNE